MAFETYIIPDFLMTITTRHSILAKSYWKFWQAKLVPGDSAKSISETVDTLWPQSFSRSNTQVSISIPNPITHLKHTAPYVTKFSFVSSSHCGIFQHTSIQSLGNLKSSVVFIFNVSPLSSRCPTGTDQWLIYKKRQKQIGCDNMKQF